MPIVNIKTMKGALNLSQKKELHQRITNLMVEIEGNGNKDFAKFVVINIDENNPENFSMGGQQASEEFIKKMTSK